LVPFLLLVLAATPAWAEGETAQTAGDPEVSLDVLTLRLEPLRRGQLAAEADAWVGLLQAKLEAMADLRVRLLEAEGDEKTKEQDELTQAELARAALVQRVDAVLAAWGEKGGDASELETYVATAGGLKLSIADAGTAWKVAWGWLKSPEGGMKFGKNILYFLLLLFAFRVLARLLGRMTNRALDRFNKTPELLRVFLSNSVRNVTFAVGIVVALSQLGVNIGPLLAAIGAAGLVIGFALQGVLSNFASGVMILLYRPYDLGDVIDAGGVTGKVAAMSLVSTTMKTPDNQVVVVPNSSIWGSVITNITGSDTRRVDMLFGVGYDDDLNKAEKILEEIVTADPRVLKDPAPVVVVGELADSSVNFHVRPWTKTSDYWDVFFDVTRKVKDRFDAEGISIPYPQQDVHLHPAPATP
ncbi:MAG: mechanosensitive ion channel family protein, partial [Planctomycetota bacterium]